MNQWVLIIILIVVLILFGFGRPFLDEIARGLSESIYNFKAGIRREPSRQDGDFRSFLLLVLALIAVAINLSVLSLDVFSTKQKFALTVVLLGWIGAGYWAFGRTSGKRNRQ
ncbi:MAG: twin-arginine translocase TatA/TatE family subunit [Chloracidobacterium sp.]|nr:twin-arginine translocase TatA/TatE family subunit [Chloracidobacterium sp.]